MSLFFSCVQKSEDSPLLEWSSASNPSIDAEGLIFKMYLELEFLLWLSGLRTWHRLPEDAGSIPGLTPSGLRIGHCHKLGHRLQTQLGSSIAVAVVLAGSCSSNSTPSLGTSICPGCSPEKKKNIYIQSNLSASTPSTYGQPPLALTVFFCLPDHSLAL